MFIIIIIRRGEDLGSQGPGPESQGELLSHAPRGEAEGPQWAPRPDFDRAARATLSDPHDSYACFSMLCWQLFESREDGAECGDQGAAQALPLCTVMRAM